MTTHYYTATSLDGFVATEDHSLDWLLKQEFDENGPMAYPAFIEGIGALAMGASTYEWIMRQEQGVWSYAQPTWVFTHRALELPAGADVRLTHEDIRAVHEEMTAAAGGRTRRLDRRWGRPGRPVRRRRAARRGLAAVRPGHARFRCPGAAPRDRSRARGARPQRGVRLHPVPRAEGLVGVRPRLVR